MLEGTELLNRFVTYIIDPAILLVFTAGFLVFVWGIFEMILAVSQGKDATDGKMHLLWGLVGMLIMVSVYGIVALIDNTFGLDPTNPDIGRFENIQTGANFFGQ